jgi:methylglutaconyl-CoA hydratase
MNEDVHYETAAGVATITLQRPTKRNALRRPLIAGLTASFTAAAADTAVRAVVLRGAGPAFCAGMDLEELQASLTADRETLWQDADHLGALFDLIYTLPKPTIALVHGAAVAGGAGLVSVCDFAIATPQAKFGYPEVRRGLVAALVLPHLLRHVGERAARDLLLTGRLVDAGEALRMGLINVVVPEVDISSHLDALLESLKAGGPEALAATKRLLHEMSHQALSIADLAKESATPRLGEECRRGLGAFFAGTPAPWVS